VAYAASGGILAGVYTDVFQGATMAVASVLVFLAVLDAGEGLASISRTILAADAPFLSPWGHVSPLAALSFFFVFSLGTLGQPHVLHKFYMIRDPRRLKWYPLLATVALILMTLLFFGVGIAVKALVVDGAMPPLANPDHATPLFLLGHTPLLLAAVVFAGVAAAIMSTVDSFLNVGAAAVVHDLPVAFGRRPGDELRRGRIATVAIALAAASTAQLSGTLVAFLGIFGWGLFASTLVPALGVGLNWKGATRAGAVASIATGLGLTLLLETLAYLGAFTFPDGVTVSGASLVASILVFFAVSAMTRRRAEPLDADVHAVMEA
ncbi:MAG: sodium:solute symporter family transporter, partial [Gemmatimonadota bacterium]